MSNNKIISWIVKICLLAVPVLPLVVTRSLFFPFITGRNFIFRVLVEIAFIFWLWLIMSDSEYGLKYSPIVLAFSLLITIIFLSTIFGISPYKSFWSSFERMEGFWAYFHYFLYFLMLGSLFKKEDWKKFFYVSLSASLITTVYAFLQFLGKLDVHQGDTRLDATMGNATYLAIYLVIHIFLFLYFLFTEFKNKNNLFKLGIYFIVLSQLLIVYKTATRGSIIGLFAGIFIFFIVNSLWGSGKLKKFSPVFISLVIFVPIIFWLVKDTNFVKNSETLSRFASISLNETTTQSRFIIWNMAYQAWKEKPILGWGPESFVYIFSKYYDPQLWRQEPWFDRAHNVFLDWLTSTGALGLVFYLGLFVASFYVIKNLYRKGDIDSKSLGLFLGLLVAYFIHNIFVFDNFSSYILFFALLAYWHSEYVKNNNNEKGEQILPALKYITVGIVTIVVMFSLYSFNVKPVLASKSILDTLRTVTYSQEGNRVRDLELGMDTIKKGLAYNTFGTTEIREQLSQYAERISADPATSNEEKKRFSSFALSEAKKQVEEFPYDIRAKAFLITMHTTANDPASAVLVAKDALSVSNKRQQFYFLLGEAYFKEGEEEQAIQAMKSAYELAPEYPDAISNYAVVLIFSGREKEAEVLVKKHYGTEVIGDLKYVNAYAAIGDFAKLTVIWEKIVEANPDNLQYRLSLASTYVKTFQDAKAIAELQKIIELNPNFKSQGEIYIKQIKEGKLQR